MTQTISFHLGQTTPSVHHLLHFLNQHNGPSQEGKKVATIYERKYHKKRRNYGNYLFQSGRGCTKIVTYFFQILHLKGAWTHPSLEEEKPEKNSPKLPIFTHMNIEKNFHMRGGIGNNSYANNSHLQVLFLIFCLFFLSFSFLSVLSISFPFCFLMAKPHECNRE